MTDTGTTMAALLRDAAQAKGQDELFVDASQRISGDQALSQAQDFGSLLQTYDVAPQQVVAFLCLPSARHAVAWMGTVQSGRIATNLHVRETVEKLGAVLKWLGATVLVHDAALADQAQQAIAASGMDLSGLMLQDPWPETRRPFPAPSAGDVAAIILSSGTTGAPKGITHTHHSLAQTALGGRHPFALDSGARALLFMQTSFAAWSVITLPVLAHGGTLIYGADFTPENFLQTCADEHITHAPLIPTMWRMVFAAGPENYDLSALKLASVSGEPPSSDDIAQLEKRICNAVSFMYVASETMSGSTVFCDARQMDERGKTGCVGAPAPGVSVAIVSPEDKSPLPQGETGEIAISGPSNAAGYWKAPELTAGRFRDGWWYSGDLGYLDADGDLWVVGRNDNTINSGGIKIAGEEIELALMAHPSVAQCAVVGQPDPRFGRRIEAYFVPHGPRPSDEELDRFLRQEKGLSGFKIPKVFTAMNALPTGPTGKLYRKALIRSAPATPQCGDTE